MSYAPSVRDHMTPISHFLELSSSLSSAAASLRHLGVDCMPVVDEGSLCGLLLGHDLAVAQELGHSAHDVLVRDLPLQDVYLASPDAALVHVAREMATLKVGCAVIQEGVHVVGMLSWQAAMAALVEANYLERTLEPDRSPSEVRSLILMAHVNIRRLLRRVERTARKILTTPVPQPSDLEAAYQSAHMLCNAMAAHLDLEDHVLAPALEALDAWGKVRADKLRSEHAEQTLVLHSYLRALERVSGSRHAGSALGALVQQLVASLRTDMQTEEETLLRPDLLCDDPTAVVVEAG
jgi:CBS domain-containing protein